MNSASNSPERSYCLQLAATNFAPVTQASSLGIEDMVLTHLINSLKLDIPVFVLDTGMLHHETLALLERTKATSRIPINVYRPLDQAVVQFMSREGKDAMYRSVELRKACCHIRKVERRCADTLANWLPMQVDKSSACNAG